MNKKAILFAGTFTFSALMVMSVYFYKERTIFTDAAFQIFSILRTGDLAIQHNRFGGALMQVFPFLCCKLGLSLKYVALSDSLGFCIFYSLTFFITCLIIKNSRVSLAILLFNILMITHTFYFIHIDLVPDIALTLLYFAILTQAFDKNKLPDYIFAVTPLLLFTIAFFHPLIIIAFTYLSLFYITIYPARKKLLLYNLAAFFSFYVLKALFFKTWYDGQALQGIGNITGLASQFFTLPLTKDIIKYFIKDYQFTAILFIISVIFYIAKRSWLKLAITVFFFLGTIYLISVTYPAGATQFYIENQYVMLSLFIIMPFVYDLLPLIKSEKAKVFIISVIVLAGLIRIYTRHDIYTQRLNWCRNMLEKTSNLSDKKLVIKSEYAPMDTLLMTWGSSYEFWLLSTIEGKESRSVIIEEIPGEYGYTTGNNKTFITKFVPYDYNVLDRRYFIFNDTGYYKRY